MNIDKTHLIQATTLLLNELNIYNNTSAFDYITNFVLYQFENTQSKYAPITNWYKIVAAQYNKQPATIQNTLRKTIRKIKADNNQILRKIFDENTLNSYDFRGNACFLIGLYNYLRKRATIYGFSRQYN